MVHYAGLIIFKYVVMIYPPEVEEFLKKYDRILLDDQGIIKLFALKD
jgi:hypothetical protein